MFTRLFSASKRMSKIHIKCRNSIYGKGETVDRFPVPDDKVLWSVEWTEYAPVYFEVSKLKAAPWADPDILHDSSKKLKFNDFDNKLNRVSHEGNYELINGIPRNPHGRTGITGRGCLGKWGPNHAADPIVTRWKRGINGERVIHPRTARPILQFVSILRGDVKQWAIPGGMVDCGENVSVTLKREFSEEAMNSIACTPEQRLEIQNKLDQAFNNGVELYKGYVDDPRNTDNCWMETVAVNFHDDNGDSFALFDLTAGDDAVGVKWTDISSDLKLYASHSDFVEKTAIVRDAHW